VFDLNNTCCIDKSIVIMNYLYANSEDARVFINAKLLEAEERTSTALHRIFKVYQERRFKDVKKTCVVYLSKIHELSRQERQEMIDRNKPCKHGRKKELSL